MGAARTNGIALLFRFFAIPDLDRPTIELAVSS